MTSKARSTYATRVPKPNRIDSAGIHDTAKQTEAKAVL